MSEENNAAVETKRSAVTFKIPDSDDRLGKSVGDITAGKLSLHKNILLYIKYIFYNSSLTIQFNKLILF